MMASAPTAPDLRLEVSQRQRSRAARPLLAIGGSTISLFGAGLAIISFSALDGGDYFLFAGFGLIVSGALLAKRHIAGAWSYLAVFAATLIWSLHGAGPGGSPVAYRIVGPIVMLVMLALLMPALRRWSTRRTVAVLAALIMATVMIGDLSSTDRGPLASQDLVSQSSKPDERSPAMNSDLHKSLRIRGRTAAAILPPATMEETPWDILLALHSDRHCKLSLAKLASLVSVTQPVLDRWLAGLEQRQLITGVKHLTTGELRAVLTSAGRELLDRYLSATSVLQAGIQ